MRYRRTDLWILMLTLAPMLALAQPAKFFVKADKFFSTHVKDGLVDYETIVKDPAPLNELVGLIAVTDLSEANTDSRKAFYINSYNLLVIKTIVDNFPMKSPLDLKTFFSGARFTVAGEQLSLDDIEHKKLLDATGDPRLHMALVCGALGCPPLAPFAYKPDQVDKQLDIQAHTALNDPDFIRVDTTQHMAQLSQIFFWYRRDFVIKGPGILEFINKYRDIPIPADYTLAKYTYDWALNIQP